jgi:hypothetical protein
MINSLLKGYEDMNFPIEINSPPPNWIVVKTYGYSEDKLTIYYVP